MQLPAIPLVSPACRRGEGRARHTDEIAAFNAEQADRALILKIGIDTGPAIAATIEWALGG